MSNKDPRYGMCKEEKILAWGISVLVLLTIGMLIYLTCIYCVQ